jgi:hypothetical protein
MSTVKTKERKPVPVEEPVGEAPAPERAKKPDAPLWRRGPVLAFEFLASYGFATVLFLLLLLLTFLGTMEQVNMGLFETQQKYFNSWFLVHEFFGRIPVLLPGVTLLLILLSINLVAGGIIRIRKKKTTLGVLIAHFGILFMLFGGLVQYVFAEDGHMTLYEGQRSNVFTSYYDWEISISDGAKEYIVSGDRFQDMTPAESREFVLAGVPFDLKVKGYQRNSVPAPAVPNAAPAAKVIDGFYLQPKALEKEAEQNIAGAYVELKDKDTGQVQEAILWGWSDKPLAVNFGGKVWNIDLHKKRTPVPFTIVLDKFHHEMHPGTRQAKLFRSDVTKIENGTEQKIRIEMNKPLRHAGYTFYQSGWGPQNAKPGDPLFSTFSVVRNPADKFPLIACLIVTAGMLIHFGQKLIRYLRAENKRLAA